MAETTTEIIFKVGTDQAVKSIADLRQNITKYKEQLNEAEIGSKEYDKTLKELQVNQAALKNAMHATTIEGESQEDAMKRLTKDAQGLGTSYNSLVKQMADLTQQFRATEDAAKRAELADQIKAINTQLKDMDAMRGNFQRNVGDYFNQITAPLEGIIQKLPSSMGAVKQVLDDTTKSLSLMGKQPIIGIIALLSPIISKIVEGLKDNKTALDSINRVLEALKPVADFFAGILQEIAKWLSTAVDYALDLAKNSGTSFSQIVAGAVGVGNAILQFLLAPIRTVIEAAKGLGNVFSNVFKGQFREAADAAKTALNGIGDAWKNGFSFSANFEAGKKVAADFIAGLESPTSVKKAEEAGKKIGEAAGKSAYEKWKEWFDKIDNEVTSRLDKRRELREQLAEEAAADIEAETKALAAQIDAEWKTEFDAQQAAMEEAKTRRENFIQGMQSAVDSTSSILGSLADMMESGTQVTEKEARRAKNLRIASATIDMFQGATTAYSTAQSLGVPMGPIVGAINAAAVIATGMANIAKIKSQNVSASSSSTGVSTPTVSTPAITPQVAQVRTITSASEEDRLNQMASDQRVYILNSDLEAAANSRRVLATETSF